MSDFEQTTVWRRIRGRISENERGCWIWQGGKKKTGHGVLVLNVHRFVYEMLVGPVPPELHLDHFECDNPSCVNPAHLRPTTPRANTMRGTGPTAIHASATHCPRNHPYDVENTYLYTDKEGFVHRTCRQCRRDRNKARSAARAKKRGGPGYTRPG